LSKRGDAADGTIWCVCVRERVRECVCVFHVSAVGHECDRNSCVCCVPSVTDNEEKWKI